MIITFLLAFIFLSSALTLWYLASGRLPELIAIPDQVITERFHEDSAKIRLFALNFKTWYKEQRHRELFWRIYVKALYKIHIFLLRFDNEIVAALKKVKEVGKAPSVNGEGDYIKQIYQEKFRRPKDNLIREVRAKK